MVLIKKLLWDGNAGSAAEINESFITQLRALSLKELKQLKEELKNHFDSLRSLKEGTYEVWMDNDLKVVAFKMALIEIYFPVFEGDKLGEYFFSSTKRRYFMIHHHTIYYYADAECTDLKGEIELEESDKWKITGCDVTITQPKRVWEISFASKKDARRFQEICKQE
jgi:hypothetical protein